MSHKSYVLDRENKHPVTSHARACAVAIEFFRWGLNIELYCGAWAESQPIQPCCAKCAKCAVLSVLCQVCRCHLRACMTKCAVPSVDRENKYLATGSECDSELQDK